MTNRPTGHRVRHLESPTDPAALLPDVARALDGDGPAIAVRPPGRSDAAPHLPEVIHDSADDPTDPVVAVIGTSGSTGNPRAVALRRNAMLASAHATHERLGGPGQWLLALPVHHVAGWQVLVRTVVAGLPLETMPSGAPFTATAFTDAVRGTPASDRRRYTALVPTQLRRLLESGGAAVEALAAFDGVLIGGAALPPALHQEALAAGVAIRTTYGSTETNGGCIYDGVPLRHVSAELDDDGRVTIRGPVVAAGYLSPRGELVADPAFGADQHGRYFVTGDVGRWQTDSESGRARLQIIGRHDDAITSGGLTWHPQAIENAIAAIPGIAEVAVVGVPDQQWGERVVAAVVLAPGAATPDAQTVRRHVDHMLEPGAGPREVHVLPALPLRGPGKIDRRALRHALHTPDATTTATPE